MNCVLSFKPINLLIIQIQACQAFLTKKPAPFTQGPRLRNGSTLKLFERKGGQESGEASTCQTPTCESSETSMEDESTLGAVNCLTLITFLI